MAVYGDGKRNIHCCGDMKIHQNCPRNIAADLPPDDRRCERTDFSDNDSVKAEHRSFVDDLLDGGIDSDKLLIAALLYLLIKEGADIKLMIALGYILL
ncbi:hypothetical protein [uncultured Ruminococcus sp.]|uniref:hypothetical protein n=1 Tax=uncultured Ruminococcus sp. TaxID=165186 RepID=UPI00262D8341|nr:hypothetical protein [uncultured Ruminococcus sp.]